MPELEIPELEIPGTLYAIDLKVSCHNRLREIPGKLRGRYT